MITLVRDNVEIIVASEEKAQKKVSEGFRRLYGRMPAKAVKSAEIGDNEQETAFKDMTKSELIAYAYENDIEINPRARKADILAAVSERQA